MTKFTIDGKEVVAQKGQTILDVARENDIYIPTMCYLEKTNPAASCRLCVVDVKDVDGFVLSCQTPPTEGIEVTTNTDELYTHRQNIMKMYSVNHPLECGVCDKSGECDLQNKTLEFGVDKQTFSAREQSREIKDWGMIQYDENLCILCEKCVHICNEVIGDDAIEVHFGGYSSGIKPKNSETLECTDCGECVAVCPVGALVNKDFKYTANAWELNQIPATCTHCSAGCEINYEVKNSSISDSSEKIYRVTNDFEKTTLCGAGRFGSSFTNSSVHGDVAEAVQKVKEADYIIFNSQITNEEARILQKMKEERGLKLINPEAKKLQNFLKGFGGLYNGTLKDIEESNQVIVFGGKIATDNPAVRYKLTEAYKKNRAFISYLHPVYEPLLQTTIKQFVHYEVGTEEGVMALLVKTLLENCEIPTAIKNYLNSLDDGYLSGESMFGEEEFEKISTIGKRAKKRTLILGSDLINHDRAENIGRLAGLLQQYSDIKVVVVPVETNSIGVSQICELDESATGKGVGYNMSCDYTISALGDGDLSVAPLNQQEGTFTTIDKIVVKTNVAVPYKGAVLNDIAKKVLNDPKEYTVDYSREIYNCVDFDSIDGNYPIETEALTPAEPEDVEDLPTFDGTVIYHSNPVLQFNPFTAKVDAITDEPTLLGSQQFAIAGKLKDGDRVEFEVNGEKFNRLFKIDSDLKGTVALNPLFDKGLSSYSLSSNYRFQKAKIVRVES